MRLMILATALALSTSMATAQNDMVTEMSQGLTMLENSAKQAFAAYGIEADVMSLTLNQLAEINGAMSINDNEADTKAAIEAVLQR